VITFKPLHYEIYLYASDLHLVALRVSVSDIGLENASFSLLFGLQFTLTDTACGNWFTVQWQRSWENKIPVLIEIWTDSHECSKN